LFLFAVLKQVLRSPSCTYNRYSSSWFDTTVDKMLRSRAKIAPTHYPRLLFHGLRAAQLLSSVVVGGIMCYFLYQLQHDHWKLPWTFIILVAVSFFTVLALTVTIVLHCCCGLNPRFNLFLNSTLSVPWAVGFALLAWWSRFTLGHSCNTDNWRDDVGIWVCQICKALFAFTLFGCLSTLGALALDVSVYRKHTRLGKYNAMKDLNGNEKRSSVATYDPRTSSPFDHQPLNGSAGPFAPTQPYGAGPHYAESAGDLGTFRDQPTKSGEYAAPAEQYGYDTGYHGAHHERGANGAPL